MKDAFWFKVRRSLTYLTASGTLLLPWAALIAATPLFRPSKDAAVLRAWAFVWLIPFGLLALVRLLQGDVTESLTLLGQGVIAWLAFLAFKLPQRAVRRGLETALLALVLIGASAQLATKFSWRGYTANLTTLHGIETRGGLSLLSSVSGRANAFSAFRLWQLPAGRYDLVASFEARASSGTFGWSWDWDPKRVNKPYQLAPLADDTGVFTRVINPTGPDPNLYRTYKLQEPLSRKKFRAQVALRSLEPDAPCGAVNLVEEGGKHLGSKDFCLSSVWQTVELLWTAPKTADKQKLVLVLNNLSGHSYDIGQVKVHISEGETWLDLPVAAPLGMIARLSLPGSPPQTLHALPARTWTVYKLRLKGLELPEKKLARLDLRTEDGTTLETRRVSLATVPEKPVRSQTSLQRQSFWFGHPNLAGHSAAAVGLVLLVLARSARQGLVGVGLAFLVIALTGSRTALIGLIIGNLVYFLFSNKLSRVWIIAVLSLGTFLGFFIGGFDRALTGQGLELIGRLEVWKIAWQAFVNHPFTGLEENFSSFWRNSYRGGSQETLQHAHNLWLEFATRFGILGAAAMVWLTVGLSVVAWRWGKERGLALILPLLVMNMLDLSLLYSSVLFPFILGLRTLYEQENKVR